MAANVAEWTTEYSTNTYNGKNYPCVCRGGNYKESKNYTTLRYYNESTDIIEWFSFRTLLNLK